MIIPMREKYVDEAVGIWIVFGTSRNDGTVDVSDQQRDIFNGLPKEIAEQVCNAQERFRAELYRILCKEAT